MKCFLFKKCLVFCTTGVAIVLFLFFPSPIFMTQQYAQQCTTGGSYSECTNSASLCAQKCGTLKTAQVTYTCVNGQRQYSLAGCTCGGCCAQGCNSNSTTYSCKNNQCVADPNGNFSDSSCGGQCTTKTCTPSCSSCVNGKQTCTNTSCGQYTNSCSGNSNGGSGSNSCTGPGSYNECTNSASLCAQKCGTLRVAHVIYTCSSGQRQFTLAGCTCGGCCNQGCNTGGSGGGTPGTHLACDSSTGYVCKTVNGGGNNTCSSQGSSCKTGQGSGGGTGGTHLACDSSTGYICKIVTGAGSNACTFQGTSCKTGQGSGGGTGGNSCSVTQSGYTLYGFKCSSGCCIQKCSFRGECASSSSCGQANTMVIPGICNVGVCCASTVGGRFVCSNKSCIPDPSGAFTSISSCQTYCNNQNNNNTPEGHICILSHGQAGRCRSAGCFGNEYDPNSGMNPSCTVQGHPAICCLPKPPQPPQKPPPPPPPCHSPDVCVAPGICGGNGGSGPGNGTCNSGLVCCGFSASASVTFSSTGLSTNPSVPTTTVRLYLTQHLSTAFLARAQTVLGAQSMVITGSASFDSAIQKFTVSNFSFTGIPDGQYDIILHVDGHLDKRLIPANGMPAFLIVSGKIVTDALPVTVIPGDISPNPQGDNFVDISDYNALASCYNQAPTGPCKLADLNNDGKIDNVDMQLLQDAFGNIGDSFTAPQFGCVPDPSCNQTSKTLELCPLKCTKQ